MSIDSVTETERPSNRPMPWILVVTVLVCVGMIGFAGMMKYEIDRAQNALTTPHTTVSSDQDTLRKLRQNLGYGGFVGIAQGFATTHDASALTNMKTHLETAHDMFAHLPEKMSADVRGDVQSILATFDNALSEANKAMSDPISFTTSDMAPLYAALPVLDSRVESVTPPTATNAAAAQDLQFWTMMLTVLSWIGLIFATLMSAALYLTRKGGASSELRTLTESVRNMVKSDLRSSVWGMHRTDDIGDLARALDLARYHFSQLPDLSLMSEQGPVRMRFEGNTRSLFDAVINHISSDAEQIKTQTTQLADSIVRQQDAIDLVFSRVEAIMHNIEKRGMDGDKQVQQVMQDMLSSADSLKHAQEHAADQLNRIVPYMQERAQGMAEITQLTGRQVAQALATLTQTERGLRANADQGQEVIQKLSSTAADLGDRMFGAMNLLQASGKVLNETTEKTQSHLNEAVEKLNRFLANPALGTATSYDSSPLAERMEAAIEVLETLQNNLAQRFEAQTQAAQAQIDLLTTQSSGLLMQSAASAQTISTAADHLRDEREKLDESLRAIVSHLSKGTGELSPDSLLVISGQIERLSDKLSRFGENVPAPVTLGVGTSPSHDIVAEMRRGFTSTQQSLEQIGARLVQQANAAFDRTGLVAEESRRHILTVATQVASSSDAVNKVVLTAEQNQRQLIELSNHAERTTEALTTLGQVAEVLAREPSYVTTILDEIRTGFDSGAYRLEQISQSSNIAQQIGDQLTAIQQGIENIARDPIFARNLIVEIKSGFRSTLHSLEQLVTQMGQQVGQQVTESTGRASLSAEQTRQQIQELVAQAERTTERLSVLSLTTDLLVHKPPFIEPVLSEIRTGFGATIQNLENVGNRMQIRTDEQLGRTVLALEQNRLQLSDIAANAAHTTEKLTSVSRATDALLREPTYVTTLLSEIKSGFETTVHNLEQIDSHMQQQSGEVLGHLTVTAEQNNRHYLALGTQADRITEKLERMAQNMDILSREPLFVPAIIGEMRTSFGTTIRTLEQVGQTLQQQAREAWNKTDATGEATQRQIGELTAQAERMTQALTTLGQATDVLTREPAFAKNLLGEIRSGFGSSLQGIEEVHQQIQNVVQDMQGKSGAATEQTRQQLIEMALHIERITKKLSGIEQSTATLAREPGFFENLLVEIKTDFEVTSRNIERMREQFTNLTLTGATQPSGMMSDGLRDQWYQITAQIEATRNGIETMLTQQINRLESRIDNKPADADTRRQVALQSQALAELVGTLSTMDSHMKDIQTQMTEMRGKQAG